MLMYDNQFNQRKDGEFLQKWEGPFQILKKYDNGTYQLQDLSGKVNRTRVNKWCLKPYFQRFEANIDKGFRSLGSP